MNFGFARVCQRSHNFSHYSLEWLEWCWMHDGERLFSVAWHWMLKTCIQLSITRVESLAVQRKRASNEQQRGRPITTQVVGGGTQSKRDCWDCLKFHRCHKPQWSRLPKTKSLWWGSGQELMADLLYGKEVTMARAVTLPDFLYQKEIEVGERIDLSSNSVATTDISSVSSIIYAEDEREGQELGLTPVSPGTCRSKFQLLQYV